MYVWILDATHNQLIFLLILNDKHQNRILLNNYFLE